MGLLSDTKSRKKLADVLTEHYQKLITLSFIIGIIWFCLLACDVFNNKTYFSENALLPGLVVREFNPRSSLSRRLEALNEESKSKSPFAWIQGQFHQLGLDVYQNNFTVQYPFGSKSVYRSKNFYAILRAPKVSSTEAIVISTPYRDRDSIHRSNDASIALMIELAQAFRQQTYWSKDIIFLITQFENIGFQAWLDAYHGVRTSDYITSEKLPSSSGPLQGVVNLEISDYHFSHVDVKIEGLHGQLPNLDFFNLVVELCAREQIPTTFAGRFNHYSSSKSIDLETWLNNFLTMSSMMALQSTGLPSGGHGLFHRFGIQALTLRSVDEKKSVNLIQMGRVVEGTVRSLNNLLEKFHQSFFFYLLPSTRSYVSIGLYMPPFALIAVPILLKALYLYLNGNKTETLSCKLNYWIAFDTYVFHLVCGLITFLVPYYIHHAVDFLPTEDLIYYALLALMSTWLVSASFVDRRVEKQNVEYKMCFTLLMLGGFMFTLALVNISLALVFTVLYVPISISLQYKGKGSALLYLILLSIHPFVFSYLIVVGQSFALDSKAAWSSHFVRGVGGHKKAILYTMEDMLFFGNWNYKIVTLIILPLWLNLWSLKIMAGRVVAKD